MYWKNQGYNKMITECKCNPFLLMDFYFNILHIYKQVGYYTIVLIRRLWKSIHYLLPSKRDQSNSLQMNKARLIFR